MCVAGCFCPDELVKDGKNSIVDENSDIGERESWDDKIIKLSAWLKMDRKILGSSPSKAECSL